MIPNGIISLFTQHEIIYVYYRTYSLYNLCVLLQSMFYLPLELVRFLDLVEAGFFNLLSLLHYAYRTIVDVIRPVDHVSFAAIQIQAVLRRPSFDDLALQFYCITLPVLYLPTLGARYILYIWIRVHGPCLIVRIFLFSFFGEKVLSIGDHIFFDFRQLD